MPLELPFDLLLLVKESQLQHGLRTSDYARYHKYLTNRIATVRKQLNLRGQETAGRKGHVTKYQKKEVTAEMLLSTVPAFSKATAEGKESEPSVDDATIAAQAFAVQPVAGGGASVTAAGSHGKVVHNCGGGRYLELLALLTERCLAIYEDAVQKRGKNGTLNGEDGVVGGFGNSSKKGSTTAAANDSGLLDARKKLNKAVKHAEELYAVASAVSPPVGVTKGRDAAANPLATASARAVVASCEGYLYEVKGLCAAGHSGPDSAANAFSHFQSARHCYAKTIAALNDMIKAANEGAAAAATNSSVDTLALEKSFTLLISKCAEIDDRIIFAQSQQKGSAAAYKPEPLPTLYTTAASKSKTTATTADVSSSSTAANAAVVITTAFLTPQSTVEWMIPTKSGALDEIPVFNLKVKENLREAAAVGAPETMRMVVGNATVTAGAASSSAAAPLKPNAITAANIINVGQQLRVVDLYDRAIGYLNEALVHARSEIRGGGGAGDAVRRQIQRLTLFLQFHIARFTADRTFFVIECLARRFWFHVNLKTIGGCGVNAADKASSSTAAAAGDNKYARRKANKLLLSGGKASKIPTASPLEIVRLYTTAQNQLTDAHHIPGVEGSDAPVALLLEQHINVCKAGRMLYAGASWAAAAASVVIDSAEAAAEASHNHTSALQALNAAKKHMLFTLSENQQNAKALAAAAAAGEDMSVVLPAALSLDFVSERVNLSILTSVVAVNLAPYRVEEAAEKKQTQKSTTTATTEAGDSVAEKDKSTLTAARYLIDHLDSEASFAFTEEKKLSEYQKKQIAENIANGKGNSKNAATTKAEVVTRANLIPLPPAFIPVAPKPIFVDIAATFVDFGDFSAAGKAKPATIAPPAAAKESSSVSSPTSANNAAADTGSPTSNGEKKGWLGGWGWSKKQ